VLSQVLAASQQHLGPSNPPPPRQFSFVLLHHIAGLPVMM
jgi:hypothetical protein